MTKKTQRPSWRDRIEIHPAADLFPLMAHMDPAGLQAMADFIAKNPMQVPDLMPVIHAELLNPDYSSFNQMKWKFSLLDGRNELDAMELAGIKFTLRQDKTAPPSTPRWYLDVSREGVVFSNPLEIEQGDPWEYVRRANIERRMLDRTGKRELITVLLKATPEKSDRAIAKLAGGASKNTVAKVREEAEARGQIDHVKTRIDSKGRKSPARKKTKTSRRRSSVPKTDAAPHQRRPPPRLLRPHHRSRRCNGSTAVRVNPGRATWRRRTCWHTLLTARSSRSPGLRPAILAVKRSICSGFRSSSRAGLKRCRRLWTLPRPTTPIRLHPCPGRLPSPRRPQPSLNQRRRPRPSLNQRRRPRASSRQRKSQQRTQDPECPPECRRRRPCDNRGGIMKPQMIPVRYLFHGSGTKLPVGGCCCRHP